MPFLPPNQQRQGTEGFVYTSKLNDLWSASHLFDGDFLHVVAGRRQRLVCARGHVPPLRLPVLAVREPVLVRRELEVLGDRLKLGVVGRGGGAARGAGPPPARSGILLVRSTTLVAEPIPVGTRRSACWLRSPPRGLHRIRVVRRRRSGGVRPQRVGRTSPVRRPRVVRLEDRRPVERLAVVAGGPRRLGRRGAERAAAAVRRRVAAGGPGARRQEAGVDDAVELVEVGGDGERRQAVVADADAVLLSEAAVRARRVLLRLRPVPPPPPPPSPPSPPQPF